MEKTAFRWVRRACLAVFLAHGCAAGACADEADPLQLAFHRQAVRRFVFSQEISFGKLVPAEVQALDAMHPTLPTPGAAAACSYTLAGNTLEVGNAKGGREGDSALYVSGVQPYAAYRIDIRSLAEGAEVAAEFASLDRKTRADVVVAGSGLALRLFKDGQPVREVPLLAEGVSLPQPPYRLTVELSGVSVAVFATKDERTVYLGNTDAKSGFGDIVDFRSRAVMAKSTFNLATKVPPGGKVVVGEVAAGLSSGIGQADIRLVTHANGAPYIEGNRFWYTFSCRGLGTADAWQGVMSIDPSIFDPRFEGVIVFDRGDGLLRNDYASHVFYDDEAKEWRALTCCFSIAPNGRGQSGLAFASSKHDPRRGVSVMTEEQFTRDQFSQSSEDPCLIHDTAVGKWRLLTSAFAKDGIRAQLFESDNWNGPFVPLAGPVEYDSTGTLIQKLGSKWYVFSGTNKGPMGAGGVLVYSYPDLAYLGEMKVDLPASVKGGRIWAGVFPLPAGYPARYMALTMDRFNFTGIKGQNWSYGGLYFYWADTPSIQGPYEFDETK